MTIIKYIILIILGIGGGAVISGAVFAFIAIIGIVPRLAEKTKTEKYVMFYENAIIAGGIFGAFTIFFNYYIPIGVIPVMLFGLFIGIFYGCLAVSLAEILDVIPILTRRTMLYRGIKYFIVALALGKALGAVLYYCADGFYSL
ncbi:MAG: stage V sporulation protein AB [Clostridia bacterium]|nr:stage V sporulation protein AB [Clostridia bacterium]